ncbi:hypothetical protein [Sodalis sp. dw_96]|uniref:hypothetical protein n=1 Tax=Sodalis sp. dw_96 TaxID=2719794 RepID=UPI001BD54DFD|nr:hypothetical protein [Sodalis sp. dw_96]
MALNHCSLDHVPPPRELWLITRRKVRQDPPTKTAVDFLIQLFAGERELFE